MNNQFIETKDIYIQATSPYVCKIFIEVRRLVSFVYLNFFYVGIGKIININNL